jgi:hypothetical protein
VSRRAAWALLACLPFAAAAAPVELVADVPEAADHVLVYRLDIPVTGAFNPNAVPYALNASADTGPFARVAYHLQLEDAAGARTWVYVSMRAFTDTAAALGVPTSGAGFTWQRAARDLTVRSNAAGVTPGDALEGWLEFWPTNYVPANGAAVPGASGAVYDFGDLPNGDGGYGSMQVHALTPGGGGHVLFAFNRWGMGGAPFDLGIGDCVEASANGLHPDWTFLGNAGRYTTRRLDVYVLPGPTPGELNVTIEAPMPRAVYQRHEGNVGQVPVRGVLRVPADRVEARVAEGEWAVVSAAPDALVFDGRFTAPAGWHRVEIRAFDDDTLVAETEVEPVGVGEVFITAGQSNSANHGSTPLTPVDPRVNARNQVGWQPAADPQPVATGNGGSPWSALGDLLAARFDVPIGLLSVGVGGTTVGQWQPAAADALYARLTWALGVVGLDGARAVLWHQGESDARSGTSAELYAMQLDTLIRQSRNDAGWAVPWIIARVGFLPGTPQPAIDAVIQGQQSVIEADPLVYEGPETDDLLGDAWRYDQVHFNEAGLREHARRWNERIELPACVGFTDPEARPVVCPDAALPPPLPDAAMAPTDGAVVPPVSDDARVPPADLDAAALADAQGGAVPPQGDSGAEPPQGDSDAVPPQGELDATAQALDATAQAQDAALQAQDARGPAEAIAEPVADCSCRQGGRSTATWPLLALVALGALRRRVRPMRHSAR